jgi:hypothetical protein
LLGGALPSSTSDLAGLNSDPVNGLGGSAGTPGANPHDIYAAIALALIAPLKQLVPPNTLPQTLANLPSETRALDGISVPLLDTTKVSSDGGDDTLAGRMAPDLFSRKLGLDLSAWDALSETFVEL